jgi:hypothetical protein
MGFNWCLKCLCQRIRTAKKVFKKRKKSIGKPRKRQLEDGENDLKKMGVKRLEKKS